uniref:Tr-type G domain-containing protein n=1 Tax=Trichuris muris TaxID=70415 RepID=A0A5S6QCR3_TRIMR
MAIRGADGCERPDRVLNFNIGILGHVDSGKTSLAKAISQVAGTAAFDKHPESRRRGMTIDLGFSSFLVPAAQMVRYLANGLFPYDAVQITLVDCPGHASLFRTVIGGAQIVDMIFLVVDAAKGIQPQTAECIVLADIMCPSKMLIALNKVDTLPVSERHECLARVERNIRKSLKTTSFRHAYILPLSVDPPDHALIDQFLQCFFNELYVPNREAVADAPFVFYFDHCFNIRGQGTVMTGTVISGTVKRGSVVEIPALQEERKVKSIQSFHRRLNSIGPGDRAGICLPQLKTSQLTSERGLLCERGCVKMAYGAITSVTKVPYYKFSVASRLKFQLFMGYETVVAKCCFFACRADGCIQDANSVASFKREGHYDWVDEVLNVRATDKAPCHLFALLLFNNGINCMQGCRYVASRLDTPSSSQSLCRFAFHGRTLHLFEDANFQATNIEWLNVYKPRVRTGVVERIDKDNMAVVSGMFHKGSNIAPYLGRTVTLSTGEQGMLQMAFGQSGKVKVFLPDGAKESTTNALEKYNPLADEMVRVEMLFKRLMFRNDPTVFQ